MDGGKAERQEGGKAGIQGRKAEGVPAFLLSAFDSCLPAFRLPALPRTV
jgi:hypothetical protein